MKIQAHLRLPHTPPNEEGLPALLADHASCFMSAHKINMHKLIMFLGANPSQLGGVVKMHMWVLGTKLGSSARVVYALTC